MTDHAVTAAELARLRKIFDDAGQGEHNVLALVDHYIASLMAAEEKIREIDALLSANGCDCWCGCHWEEHDESCDRCLACRVSAVLYEEEPTP